MRVVIVVEAIPPYCGGGEQVAWMHAVEMAKFWDSVIITLGDAEGYEVRDGVAIYTFPKKARMLTAYATTCRRRLNDCIDKISPQVIHCHMPNVLSACINKKDRLLISTIHDGTPENELIELKHMGRARWLKFKLVRRINIHKSDIVTCVSRHSRDVMRNLYPKYAEKFAFIPNPIYERYFAPVAGRDDDYVLNFGRQIELKMGALLEAARQMPDTKFVFVGSGDMVREYGLPNVKFVGFSKKVETYIDAAAICVFPSLSENFPLVGLEAMARGKPVIATKRGFSEYIRHMKNGVLLDSAEPSVIAGAIKLLMNDQALRARLGRNARKSAQAYRPKQIVNQYKKLYRSVLPSKEREANAS